MKSFIKQFKTKISKILDYKKNCKVFSHNLITAELAHQYKEIFEENYIISKTDNRGNITYVNDEFLRVHGFTMDQVIGQTHRIIKNEFTDESVFQDLWRTITSGKKWKGIISYTTTTYDIKWLSVIIYPILKDGEIVEYLAIRQDITELKDMQQCVQDSQKELLINMGSIVESSDGSLKAHIERVSNYSYILSIACGLEEKHANVIKLASPMHDIGKIGVNKELLNAPRKLTSDEFEHIKTHSEIGYQLFKNSKLEILSTASLIAYHHHEKWDGTGYPNQLKGYDISIEGRIAAIADVFDALTTKRVYKNEWKLEEVDEYFRKESGVSFDPYIISKYFEVKDQFIEIMNKYK